MGGGLAIVGASYETQVVKVDRRKDWFSDEWYEDEYFDYDSENDSGLGLYGVLGIEVLRLTQSRLNLELRVDRPFFSLESQDMMPITFGISFSRNYNPSGCWGF